MASWRNSRTQCPVRVWGLESIKVDGGKQRESNLQGGVEGNAIPSGRKQRQKRLVLYSFVCSVVSICNSWLAPKWKLGVVGAHRDNKLVFVLGFLLKLTSPLMASAAGKGLIWVISEDPWVITPFLALIQQDTL